MANMEGNAHVEIGNRYDGPKNRNDNSLRKRLYLR